MGGGRQGSQEVDDDDGGYKPYINSVVGRGSTIPQN